ncbi:MAG: tRNA epoxyqueuosine(34) reductase QueG [candidate division Zixibacteria bacterium]|nr:tRNA epoxyqueuosine(34) reductase QueG [candidate division Zixibacteria bacterium]
MANTVQELDSQRIKSYAKKAGFDLCGITSAEVIPEARNRLLKWLERSLEGEMDYMRKDPERRSDPSLSLPGAMSVIVLALNYFQPDTEVAKPESGLVAKYARGKDYHKVTEKKIEALLRMISEDYSDLDTRDMFKWFVDYGPALERSYAARAGMGYLGKNSMLITPEFGSWVLLSMIITKLELEPDKNRESEQATCGVCQRCITNCPTHAIIAPGVIDSNKCISYLTIEKRGPFVLETQSNLHSRVFGCDICQDVCPHNYDSIRTAHEEFTDSSGVGEFVDLKTIVRMESRKEFLDWCAGTPLTRPKLEGIKRNAATILSENSENTL